MRWKICCLRPNIRTLFSLHSIYRTVCDCRWLAASCFPRAPRRLPKVSFSIVLLLLFFEKRALIYYLYWAYDYLVMQLLLFGLWGRHEISLWHVAYGLVSQVSTASNGVVFRQSLGAFPGPGQEKETVRPTDKQTTTDDTTHKTTRHTTHDTTHRSHTITHDHTHTQEYALDRNDLSSIVSRNPW